MKIQQPEIRVQTVERSLALLEILAEQNTPLPLTRISQLAKLNVSSVYRILKTLCRSGFVEKDKDTGCYRLGLKSFLIGNSALKRLNLSEVALPYLEQFVQNNNESIYLAILSNQSVVYTDAVRTASPIQIGMQTGLQVPACQTNAGKILIANLTKQEQQIFAGQYLNDQHISCIQSFLTELESLKNRGFSDGVISCKANIHEISVPIYTYLGKCVGAISIFQQVKSTPPNEQDLLLLKQVVETAKNISAAMGYRELNTQSNLNIKPSRKKHLNNNNRASSGLTSLDRIIDDLRFGDNVVWQVDNINSYCFFALFFIKESLRNRRRVVYVRFGQHESIVPREPGIIGNPNYSEYKLDAGQGFETFSATIQEIVSREGEGVCYVFDCLSDLLSEWSTDLMVGNFFSVTCPYLYQLQTIAYFAILRDRHSFRTISRIRKTTQILLELFHKDYFCIHPLKVWERYSPTMFLPHVSTNNGIDFNPLTSSAAITELFFSHQQKNGNSERKLDYWDRIFNEAAKLAENARNGIQVDLEKKQKIFHRLLGMIVGRDEKILKLAAEYFTIEDLLQIKSRMIGSGFIGGKSVGLLLSRAILLKDTSYNWQRILEPHDSFYIGSDVYYTYLVENDCWQLRLEQKRPDNYFSMASLLKEKILSGDFPDIIRDEFLEMLEYFGQAPIIVRSSSLLEDGFGNIFAGKYDSVFCANQGNLSERYEQLTQAIRDVYASTMSEDALSYRQRRGLAQNDEQMALLIQRVSGVYRKSYFFPDMAGVALSHNLYVWRPNMNPSAGMLRLVLGLGTRAVNRVGDDYARFVALDYPATRPESNQVEEKTYSQHEVDVIDLKQNSFSTIPFQNIADKNYIPHLLLFASRDYSTESFTELSQWYLSFEVLLSQTSFPAVMRKALQIIQTAYGHPVDTEFTCNFRSMSDFSINLLQCRPLQVITNQKQVKIPDKILENQIIFETHSKSMGENLALRIKRIIYISPEKYAALEHSEKYTIARLIGKLNQLIQSRDEMPTIILGPGRWGTSTPNLGIPVSFAEINRFEVFGEIAFSASGFFPELSYGTHFFQNMIENHNFYLIINESEKDTIFQRQFFIDQPNQLTNLLPGTDNYQDVIQVVDGDSSKEEIWIHAEVPAQKVICWRRRLQ